MGTHAAQRKVLVTGGSGYLGQFVVHELAATSQVVYTYHTASGHSRNGVDAVKCDLTVQADVNQLFERHGPFSAVINTAALSQPGKCQDNPNLARSLNVPSCLLGALAEQRLAHAVEALLIHVSTDQVYDGTRPMWTEACETRPVNAYGQSKLDAEAAIRSHWSKHVILRSSIIYGPQSATPVDRPLFVQFVEGALRERKPAKFFLDEYRNPIYVGDIVRIVAWLLQHPEPHAVTGTFNMGGPDRLSRLDIARAVAAHCGHSTEFAEGVPSASVLRATPSPLDISMDSASLTALLPFELTPFSAGVKLLFT